MAFQQPARQAASRVAQLISVQDESVVGNIARPSSEREVEGSQTWVLFPPPTDVTTTSYLTESERSLETPGRSRLSDLGSLNTVARSRQAFDAQPSSVLSAVDDQESDEDAELDSLDSHLPDFRSVPDLGLPQRDQIASPVFPSHDGLGSFRLDRPAIGTDAQDQIYEFEKFNPRKIRRRLDSFDHSHLNLGEVFTQQEEKRRRIEEWRLQHSKVLIDELQREERRQKKSLASMHRSKVSLDTEVDNLTWHDEDAIQPNGNHESLVARITRNIIRELFSVDDAMLSILLGQELPADDEELLAPSTTRGPQSEVQRVSASTDQSSWQIRTIERISREVGHLTHHVSPHPGAFVTYSAMQRMALPYAGLLVTPEWNDAAVVGPRTEPDKASQASLPEFQPTMKCQFQPVNVPGRTQSSDDHMEDVDMTEGFFSKEEWEKSLDLKLVFRYLVSRFASGPNTPPPTLATHHATPTQQENAAKVARIRQHHPLIAQTRPVERRSLRAVTPTSPVVLRHQSSCASESTKHSARRSSCSSRRYWDIGGSLGTGSVMASNGPMGSWGEV